VIANMDTDHLSSVVDLHMIAFGQRSSFTTRLGPAIVRLIYDTFRTEGFAYVFLSSGEVAGLLAGTFVKSQKAYYRMFLRHPIRIAGLSAWAAIRQPALIPPILTKCVFLARSSMSGGGPSKAETDAEPKVAHALSIAVSLEHRGEGIARKLWLHALEDLPEMHGVDVIVGTVLADDAATNGLYTKMGFDVVKRTENEIKWCFYRRQGCEAPVS